MSNSGYVGKRMSVRAAAAYDDDARPLSKIDAAWLKDHMIGCTKAELRDLIDAGLLWASEWHHTGEFFAETDFYRPSEVRERVAFLKLKPEQIAEARAASKKARERASEGEVHRRCTVQWLEWFGKGVRPEEHRVEGATVRVKGCFATVTLPDGDTFRKKLGATGFSFETPADRRRKADHQKQLRAQRREEARQLSELEERLRAALRGAKLESCAYFNWRDTNGRDSTITEWAPITRTAIIDAMRASGTEFARRTVERLEAGEREVVRVGLRLGIRRVPAVVPAAGAA